jgi:hypothetical protein
MRVLVCGGRGYGEMPQTQMSQIELEIEAQRVHGQLTTMIGVLDQAGITHLITGAAPGADRQSQFWAQANDIPFTRFPANWSKWGKAAGPIRNQQMIDMGHPELVIAFPGGKGTQDMIRRAHAANIPVREIGNV